MPRDRRRFRRRGFLLKAAGGAAIALGLGAEVTSTGAFSSLNADRDTKVQAASDSDALIGIVGQGPVKKGSREPMVELTNNTGQDVTFTVGLDTCSDGTLYDNVDESGCSVSFTAAAGNSQFVDIKASVKGTISYSISTSGIGFSFSTDETVEAEAGNVSTAVTIKNPVKNKEFTARRNQDDWRIKEIDVRDNDGDSDLDYVDVAITEGGSGGTVVASTTFDMGGVSKYREKNVTVKPDDSSYDIPKGQDYTLRVTAYDADGNYTSETVVDTA